MKFNGIKYLILFLPFVIFFPRLSGEWLTRKAEGWSWYEDKEEKAETIQTINHSNDSLTATQKIAKVRKELEEHLNQAILHPTKENVLAYMEMQQKWIQQSYQFAQIWLKNLLNYPRLDFRLYAPVTQYGVQIQKELTREKMEKKIRELVQSFGLLFCYNGKEKMSQAFSLVVKEFVKKYQWQVFAVSHDGIILPDFKNAQVDRGITQKLAIEAYPSLFLVDPRKRRIIPIAFGFTAIDQIEDNIKTHFLSYESLL